MVLYSLLLILGLVNTLELDLKYYVGELDNHVYVSSVINLDIILQRNINIYNKNFKKNFELLYLKDYFDRVKYHTVEVDYIPLDHDNECVAAYSSNLFTGVCDLPSDCVDVETKELDHIWYGDKVVFCAGHNIKYEKSNIVINSHYEIAEMISVKEFDRFKYLGYLYFDDHFEMLNDNSKIVDKRYIFSQNNFGYSSNLDMRFHGCAFEKNRKMYNLCTNS